MTGTAADLARRLARDAEAVCRTYLSKGRRSGGYWSVGNVTNTRGRSLYVRLHGPDDGKRAAGNWTDAATGEHGDLLDLIRLSRGFHRLTDAMDEARRFLALPKRRSSTHPAPPGSSDAARRLFAMSRPIPGTLAETYLRARGITCAFDLPALRFHPNCFYRTQDGAPPETWPALIAAVTDLDGTITGVQRTYLARDGSAKASLSTPRRAMGELAGHGVRFGEPHDAPVAGEGLETMLSLASALPGLAMVAALSASHLGALLWPLALKRLYVACDNDPAGRRAAERLVRRAEAARVEAIVLAPAHGDFNDDLRALGPAALRAGLLGQLAPVDRARFHAGTPRKGGRR